MSQDNEQYRAGFEAWARNETPGLERDDEGYYLFSHTLLAWSAWIASKREPSAEPSGWHEEEWCAKCGDTGPHECEQAGAAQKDEALDAACWQYIEEHASTHGGGHGFTITCFVPVDHEDMRCGVLAAIEAQAKAQEPK